MERHLADERGLRRLIVGPSDDDVRHLGGEMHVGPSKPAHLALAATRQPRVGVLDSAPLGDPRRGEELLQLLARERIVASADGVLREILG